MEWRLCGWVDSKHLLRLAKGHWLRWGMQSRSPRIYLQFGKWETEMNERTFVADEEDGLVIFIW